jgi:hypothetical protein
VIDDPACQEILAAAGKTISAGAAQVTGALGKGIRGIPDNWVKNGKTLSHVSGEPYGYVLLTVLAFVASKGMQISGLADGDGACRLEVIMPANLLAVEGQLIVALSAEGTKTHVEAAAKVPGQMYDWGRNKRLLAKLSQAIDTDAAAYRERDL